MGENSIDSDYADCNYQIVLDMNGELANIYGNLLDPTVNTLNLNTESCSDQTSEFTCESNSESNDLERALIDINLDHLIPSFKGKIIAIIFYEFKKLY